MVSLKVVALTGLAYTLTTLVAAVYSYKISLLTLGTVCCEPWMYVTGYSSFLLFGGMALILIRAFLKNTPAKRTRRIFFEMPYIIALLYVGGLVGNNLLVATKGSVAAMYAPVVLAIVAAFVVSVCINLWVLRSNVRKAGRQKHRGRT